MKTIRVNDIDILAYSSASTKLKSSFLVEGLLILLALIAGAYIHFNTPEIVSFILQCVILFFYFRSQKNYLWVFLLLFISFSPGGLYGRDMPLNFFSFPGLGVVTFSIAFILVTWLKVFKKKVPVAYRNSFLALVAYFIILIPIFGIYNVAGFIKGLIFFSWLLALPRLLVTGKEFDKLFFLIFLANILVFIFNSYEVFTGRVFSSLITGEGFIRRWDPDQLVRTIYGITFAHLAVVGGLLYLNKAKKVMHPLLPYSGVILGVLNIIFSGSRGWILATFFLLVTFTFFMIPRVLKNIYIFIPIFGITFFVAWNTPYVHNQITGAYDRILHREYLLDLNPDTTEIGRVQRGERVMGKFRESPILGFGFSEEGREFTDSHTGNQSLLLYFGIIGYILFLNFWFGFLKKVLSTDQLLKPKNPEFRINVLITLSFLSIFIIASTSNAALHPFIATGGALWYGLIFAYGNYLYYNQKKQNNRLHDK